MIKTYNIALKVRGKDKLAYFVGESEGVTTSIPACVWSGQSFHTSRVNMAALVFSEYEGNAREITGSISMKSWLERITTQLPYFDADIEEIRIIVLGGKKDALKGGEK